MVRRTTYNNTLSNGLEKLSTKKKIGIKVGYKQENRLKKRPVLALAEDTDRPLGVV